MPRRLLGPCFKTGRGRTPRKPLHRHAPSPAAPLHHAWITGRARRTRKPTERPPSQSEAPGTSTPRRCADAVPISVPERRTPSGGLLSSTTGGRRRVSATHQATTSPVHRAEPPGAGPGGERPHTASPERSAAPSLTPSSGPGGRVASSPATIRPSCPAPTTACRSGAGGGAL